MNKLFFPSLVFVFSVTLLTAEEPKVEDVSVEKAAKLIAEEADLVVVDIRTQEEYADGHIKEAVLIDFFGDNFTDLLKVLDKNKPVLVHCASGGRSGQALSQFRELGFLQVYHLKDGFSGWKEAGQPVEK